MDFDTMNRKPPDGASPSGANALSLEEWDTPAATKKAEPAFIPSSLRELTGHDIAQLKPKLITNVAMGLEFYVPSVWREIKNARSVHLLDPASGAKLEASGFARTDVPIEKWVGMRLPIIEKEMPYMSQVARLASLKGESWGNRIQGIVAEYQGTVPGEEEASHMLVLCMRTDSMLVSVTILAKASVFAQQRAVYNWMMSRMEIGNTDALMNDAMRAAGNRGAGTVNGTASTARVARPSVISNTVIETETDHEIGNVASGQRLMRFAILCNVFLGIWTKTVGLTDRTQFVLALFMSVLIACMGIYGLLRMAKGLKWPMVVQVPMLVLSFIPIAGLLVFILVSYQAKSKLREEGYTVGYLGAPEAIPGSNHDLRNVFIFAVLASVIGYGVISRINRPPKDLPVAEFSPPDHRFTISMPGTPTEELVNEYADVSNSHSYLLHTAQLQYSVSSYDLDTRPENNEEALLTLREEIADGYESSKLDDKTLNLNGVNGRGLRLLDHDALRLVNLYLVGKTVYMVEVNGPKNEEYSPKVAAYFDSFKLNQAR